MVWTNSDGLKVAFGTEQAQTNNVGFLENDGARSVIKLIIDTSRMSGTTGAVVTPFQNVVLPAGALITKSTLTVLTAFTSGGSATLDIGLAKRDGTELDFDGIDAAIALTALNAVGKQVVNDGALVAGTALTAAGELYIKAGTAAFTAGKAEVIIEYKPTASA